MDDDYGDDADFTAAAEAAERSYTPRESSTRGSVPTTSASKVQQPKPQALPNRSAPSSILVSSRQKGNPILNNVRSLPWEYADIPSDYVLGNTTCALFLSLKYHRLHPEYIYSRIRALGGKYNLRILLTMVDIQNHEESLKELSKTSLVNNLTLILCWSAQEAGRYLELYKSYEHASPTSIRAHQASSYSEKLVEFITVPRNINKTDAVGLVSTFGSVKAAINARPEEIGEIAGWGEKKVLKWCETVQEPFRIRKAAKRGLERGESTLSLSRQDSSIVADQELDENAFSRTSVAIAPGLEASRLGSMPPNATPDAYKAVKKRVAEDVLAWEPDEEEEALLLATAQEEGPSYMIDGKKARDSRNAVSDKEELSDGIQAALENLRNK